jgi:hypothetical protein
MLPITVLQTGQEPQSNLQMLLLLIPLILCCMMPMLMRRGQGAAAPSGSAGESDVWFTSYKPDEAYELVKKEVENWRQQSVQTTKPARFSLRKIPKERFSVSQSLPPRLYRLSDPLEGEVAFEFTEMEVGGTAVRVNFQPPARARVQTFRASLPIKLPFAAGTPCSACGRPVLPDFVTCPYCGQKLK